MRLYDFTLTGGFPLTQDELGLMQDNMRDVLLGLVKMGDNGATAYRLSGMVRTDGVSSASITDGWLYYNGEILRFAASTFSTDPAPGSGFDYMIQISDNYRSLTYYDGSSQDAANERVAAAAVGATGTDANNFPLSELVDWAQGFGELAKSAVGTIAVATASGVGNVNGNITYQKNKLTNTVQLKGDLTASSAQNFAAAAAGQFYLMGSLPTECVPADNVYFTVHYYTSSFFTDSAGVAYVKELLGTILTTGHIYINFVKPDISVAAYTVAFNCDVPLG